MGQKRKRLALSCVDCRRRKVKCDRTNPVCVRCQKGGNAEHCIYVSHTGLEPGIPTPSEDSPEQQQNAPQSMVVPSGEPYVLATLRAMSPHLEVQSRRPQPISDQPHPDTSGGALPSLFGRVSQLETHARSAGTKPVPVKFFTGPDEIDPSSNEDRRNSAADVGKVMVRGQNFSTHYYGPSFAISMLLQFEDLSKFVRGMLSQAPSLAGVKERMNAARAAAKMNHEFVYTSNTDLKSFIPDRATVDELVERYLAMFETTYRVLHVPSFRKQYEAYWQDPTSVKQDFVIILLLIMASVYCVVPNEPTSFVGRSSSRREVAIRWIMVGESWLDEQSQKHITLAHFQAHTLAFIARLVNCIKIKREWTISGRLLRFAMAVGMHREPTLLSKKISAFDQEMRRRLWHTIVELDLITTIARGMPPTIDSFSWDCSPPRNIDDEDFDDMTEVLPVSKNRSHYTRTSFLHTATESLSLRVEVLGRINSIRLSLDLDAVMQYDSKLRGMIDDFPTWKTDNTTTFAQSLASLILYEYILILHVPFASQNHNRAKSFFSVASKRDVSFKTMAIYAKMPDTERLLCTDIRDDACRAALALCHDIATNMTTDIVLNFDQALSYLDIVGDTLEKRFGTLGQGFHSLWITLSATTFLRSKISPEKSQAAYSREAADKIGKLFSQIIEKQVPMPLPNGESPSAEAFNPMTVTSVADTLESFDNAFPAFDQMNFFDDPFSDMNFDLSSMWNMDGYNGLSAGQMVPQL